VRRRISLAGALFAAALLLALGVASCKQGEGQRCQVQSDCEAGLQCNVGEGVCRAVISGDVDALPPPDAPRDAPVDAAPDAMIDAM
jgi:hypothetical protein